MAENTRKSSRFTFMLVSSLALLLLGFMAFTIIAQNDRNKLQSRKSKLEREIIEMNQELEQTKKINRPI